VRVVALTSVGRFPTVSHDTGLWWDSLSNSTGCRLERYSANAAWWRVVCSRAFKRMALQRLGWLDRLQRWAEWSVAGTTLDADAAGWALQHLKTQEAFTSAAGYFKTIEPIARYLDDLNRAQDEMVVDLSAGSRASDVDYDDSAALAFYSLRDTLLRRTVEASLADLPAADVVLFAVTSPEDLLTSVIAARSLRSRRHGVHLSLIDHGYGQKRTIFGYTFSVPVGVLVVGITGVALSIFAHLVF